MVLDQLVEIRDHRRGAGGRIGDQGLRETREFLRRAQGIIDGAIEALAQGNAASHQVVLLAQVGKQTNDPLPQAFRLGAVESISLDPRQLGFQLGGARGQSAGFLKSGVVGLGPGQKRPAGDDLSRDARDFLGVGRGRQRPLGDRGLRGVDVAQDHPADRPGGERQHGDTGEGDEQPARDPQSSPYSPDAHVPAPVVLGSTGDFNAI